MIFNFRDTKDAKTLEGHGAEYFLPKSGGAIESEGSLPLTIHNRIGNNLSIGYKGNDSILGYIGFAGLNKPEFVTAEGTHSEILHTGNMANYVVTIYGGETQRLDLKKYNNGLGRVSKEHTETEDYGTVLQDFSSKGVSMLKVSSFRGELQHIDVNGVSSDILHTGNMRNHVLPLTGGSGFRLTDGNTEAMYTMADGTLYMRHIVDDSNYKELILNSTGVRYQECINGVLRGYPLHHDGNSVKTVIDNTAPSDTSALWIDTSA